MAGDLTTSGQRWLIKAGMSGNAFRLPDTIEPGKFDVVMSMWYTCFCGNMKASQVKIMNNFKYLWRRDDDKIASRPNLGVATNLRELQFLMSSGRIDRSDFDSITVEQWGTLEGYNQELSFEHVPAVKENNRTIHPEVAKSPEALLETLDIIVNGITSGYYDEGSKTPAGTTTKAYFDGAEDAIVALEVISGNMGLYLPNAIGPSFALGAYNSYDSLVMALRRFYGEDENTETMIDVVKKILKIAKKDSKMEQKIAEFRELAHRLMIVDRDRWIKPRNFIDDRTAFMTAAENCGPFANTLFTALVISQTVPQGRYQAIQTLLNARVSDSSYKGWHLNRPELYKILDAERKSGGAANAVDPATDTIGYAGVYNRPKQNKKSQSKSKAPKKAAKPKKKSQSSSKTVERMCRTCTQAAGKPIYHDGPYGGGKNCKYGKNGKPKQSRRLGAVDKDAEAAAGGDEDDNPSDDPYSNSDDADSDVGVCEEEYLPSFGGHCYGGDI